MKKQKKLDKWFLLSWKKFIFFLIGWFLAVVLHNLTSALLKIEEAVFFTLAVFVAPVYLITSIVYTIIKKVKRNK